MTTVFVALISFRGIAQETPEKFSNAFVGCFTRYSDACMNKLVVDSVQQKALVAKIRGFYESEIKENIKGKLSISTSTRAILKDGDAKHKQIADIIVQIDLDKEHRYKMILWGCYEQNGNWYLGEKIEMKKI